MSKLKNNIPKFKIITSFFKEYPSIKKNSCNSHVDLFSSVSPPMGGASVASMITSAEGAVVPRPPPTAETWGAGEGAGVAVAVVPPKKPEMPPKMPPPPKMVDMAA